jgi:hypothetical protein
MKDMTPTRCIVASAALLNSASATTKIQSRKIPKNLLCVFNHFQPKLHFAA